MCVQFFFKVVEVCHYILHIYFVLFLNLISEIYIYFYIYFVFNKCPIGKLVVCWCCLSTVCWRGLCTVFPWWVGMVSLSVRCVFKVCVRGPCEVCMWLHNKKVFFLLSAVAQRSCWNVEFPLLFSALINPVFMALSYWSRTTIILYLHESRPHQLVFALDLSFHSVTIGFAIVCSQHWLLVNRSRFWWLAVKVWGLISYNQ